jgi:hypothetical protein
MRRWACSTASSSPRRGPALRSALTAADVVLPEADLAPLPVVVAEEAGYRWEGGRGLWIAISPESAHAGLGRPPARLGLRAGAPRLVVAGRHPHAGLPFAQPRVLERGARLMAHPARVLRARIRAVGGRARGGAGRAAGDRAPGRRRRPAMGSRRLRPGGERARSGARAAGGGRLARAARAAGAGLQCPSPGGVPEWPKGTGCKPVGSAFRGSNPLAPTYYTGEHALLAQLVEHLHGKEGVDGSSPSEGLPKVPANWRFVVVCLPNTRTHSGHICGTSDALRRLGSSCDTFVTRLVDKSSRKFPR